MARTPLENVARATKRRTATRNPTEEATMAAYRFIFIDKADRDAGTFELEAASLDAAFAIARDERGLTERESLLRLHLCTMIDLGPQVGLVRFADGSRYDGRVSA